MLVLVCSNKPKPAVHTGRKGGNHHWARDVHHITGKDHKTLCGVACDEWLSLGVATTDTASVKADTNLCRRCAAKLSG